jgi:hypothetical protein
MAWKTLALLAIVACSSRSSGPNGTAAKPGPPTVTLFALAEVRGQIEPCGCTTDPLGDIARTAQRIADARTRGPVIVVDAGGLLYSKSPIPPHLAAQEDLKADLLATVYQKHLQAAAVGIGVADLANGPGATRLPRHAANAMPVDGLALETPKVIPAGNATIGVFGVVHPDAAPGIQVGDPITSGKRAVEELRRRKVNVVVGLVQAANRRDALAMVRGIGGIDIAVLGLGRETPEPEKIAQRAENVDGTWVVVPANRGQVVSELAITVVGDTKLVDAIGPSAADASTADLDRRIAALDADLEAFAKDPSADPAFVAAKRKERDDLIAERTALRASPWRIPSKASYFALSQVRIAKAMACDPAVVALKTAYDHAAGEANVAAAKQMPPVPVPKGAATYAGVAACNDCHPDQVAFWQKTRHFQAWKTLETRGKQFDFDCTSCHVTGWDKPGGATLANNDLLRDVQCETCHGPASIHIAKEGADGTILLSPTPDLCATQCHTPEHSDTFQLEAYLRDIVGPGHGEERRKALGDGPTGRQLRAAGLAKAGASIGAGCSK